MSTTTFVFLILFFLILMTWGVGSMMSAISKLRGWNPKKWFWVSALSYDSILWFIWQNGDALLANGSTAVFIALVFFVLGLGILSPCVILILRWMYPDTLVIKTHIGQTNIIESTAVIVGHSPVVNEPKKVPLTPEKNKQANNQGFVSKIFISYRRSDSADVSGRIYDRLVDKFGKNLVFKDVDSIPLGLDFKEYLGKKVGECEVLLAIIGDRWLDASDAVGARRLMDSSDFVRIEIESALERDIPVIPLLVRNATMPREDSLPSSLRKLVYRNGISIRSDPDFHRDMDRLIKALEKLVQ